MYVSNLIDRSINEQCNTGTHVCVGAPSGITGANINLNYNVKPDMT